MFCPKCGQSQVADEVRFCSRCGFHLSGAAELLANHGLLTPTTSQIAAQDLSPRRKGVRQGGKLMLIGMFVIAFLLVFVALTGAPEEFPLLGLLVFLAGLLRLIYAFLFEEKVPAAPPAAQAYAPPRFAAPQPGDALPPHASVPARGFFARRPDTAEIVTPPSVTEHTTRLLDERDDAPGR
jgi:hypothetical protein